MIRKQNAFGCEIHWYSRIYNWPKTKDMKEGRERGRKRRKKMKKRKKRRKRKRKERKEELDHSSNTFS